MPVPLPLGGDELSMFSWEGEGWGWKRGLPGGRIGRRGRASLRLCQGGLGEKGDPSWWTLGVTTYLKMMTVGARACPGKGQLCWDLDK